MREASEQFQVSRHVKCVPSVCSTLLLFRVCVGVSSSRRSRAPLQNLITASRHGSELAGEEEGNYTRGCGNCPIWYQRRAGGNSESPNRTWGTFVPWTSAGPRADGRQDRWQPGERRNGPEQTETFILSWDSDNVWRGLSFYFEMGKKWNWGWGRVKTDPHKDNSSPTKK